MAKKHAHQPKNYNTDTMQPDELSALRALVKEFIDRVKVVDNEIETLKDDRKELIEEFKSKLDVPTLKIALQVTKLQQGIQHKDTYDLFYEVLQNES